VIREYLKITYFKTNIFLYKIVFFNLVEKLTRLFLSCACDDVNLVGFTVMMNGSIKRENKIG